MLTGLELMFMGVTRSNSGLFSTPGFLVSPVGKRGMGAKIGTGEKGNRKGKEGRGKEQRKIGGKIRRNFNRN